MFEWCEGWWDVFKFCSCGMVIYCFVELEIDQLEIDQLEIDQLWNLFGYKAL